jgi:hypothetical protein
MPIANSKRKKPLEVFPTGTGHMSPVRAQESLLKFRKILKFFYLKIVFFMRQHGKPLFCHYLAQLLT